MSNYENLNHYISGMKVPDGYDGKHPRWKEAESVPNPLVVGRVTPAGVVQMWDCDARDFRLYPLGKPVAHSEHDPFVLPPGSKVTADWGDGRGYVPWVEPKPKVFPHSEYDLLNIPQHEPGAKLDQDKPDLSLLVDFAEALEEVALVGTYGMVKYSRGGWLKVPNGIVRYTAALLRHLFKREKYDTDPWYDTPKGLPFKGRVRHDAQVAWNSLARLQRAILEERGE